MVAFGRPGMLIHTIPEFEGKPGIEGITTKEGLLHEFKQIAGVLFATHPWNSASVMSGLFRSDARRVNYDPIPIFDIVSELWNDELDSNGWKLNTCDFVNRAWPLLIS